MFNRKIKYITLSLLALLALITYAASFSQKNSALQVVFLDIGQGDAILISQGNNQMLIDGGKDGKLLLQKLGKYIPFWDRNIEIIVATHPDQDHIGGLIDVLKTYKVGSVLKTNAQSNSLTFKKFEQEIENNGSQKIEAKKDVNIKFSEESEVKVIYPFASLPEAVDNDSNDNSIVMRLDYGENSFLFTGDLPTTQENKIPGENISAKVLKVSHHGSKYATSNEFLDAVKSEDAVISVGKNNSYGHPNGEVLQRLSVHKINVFRTDEIGDVVYECKNSHIKCQIIQN